MRRQLGGRTKQGVGRLPVLSLARRKRFKIPAEAWQAQITPKPFPPRQQAAAQRFSTLHTVLNWIEAEVRAHGQIRPHRQLAADKQQDASLAVRAFGGSDKLRSLVGLPTSHVATGVARQDPEVVKRDFQRLTGGNPKLPSTKLRKRRGFGGLMRRIIDLGGLSTLRRESGASEGIRTGPRSLSVHANFDARMAELKAYMRKFLEEKHRKPREGELSAAGFGDVLTAASKLHDLTLGDIWLSMGQRPRQRAGKNSLRIFANLYEAATPYVDQGRLSTGRLRRAKRFDILNAIRDHGGIDTVNRLIREETLRRLQPRPTAQRNSPRPPAFGRYEG